MSANPTEPPSDQGSAEASPVRIDANEALAGATDAPCAGDLDSNVAQPKLGYRGEVTLGNLTHFHDLRPANATGLVEAGIDIKT